MKPLSHLPAELVFWEALGDVWWKLGASLKSSDQIKIVKKIVFVLPEKLKKQEDKNWQKI